VSRSPQFQVDGEWFPFTVEDESPIVAAQREAHLREAREREANRACETCGRRGGLAKGGDRYHGPGLCDQDGAV
jgi:hypothetical protein